MDIRAINEITKNDFNGDLQIIPIKKSNDEIVRLNKIIINSNDKDKKDYVLNKSSKVLLSAYNILNQELNYYILGNKIKNSIDVLLESSNLDELQNVLYSSYPSVDTQIIKKSSVDTTNLKCKAILSFVPDIRENEEISKDITVKFDSFIRGMYGKNFGLKVSLSKINEHLIDNIYEDLLKNRNKNHKDICINISDSKSESESISYREGTSDNSTNSASFFVGRQESKGDSKDTTEGTNTSTTIGKSYEQKNYINQEYDELLKNQILRLREMRKTGGWQTSVIIFAENKEELNLAVGTFLGAFNNKFVEKPNIKYIKEELNIFDKFKMKSEVSNKNIVPDYINLFDSNELSLVISPNFENINGFSILDLPRFNQEINYINGFKIGKIMNYNKQTNIEFLLNKNDFNKHILVAGITGSGKTNTIFSLIKNIGVPFLIIEPAKTEYRVLKSLVNDLRVYTLGKEMVSPFRLNPFKFDNKNVSIQEHIDSLKVIFTAAFTMYASMPNILEQSLINIYIKKGWSLIDSSNIFCSGEIYDELYPTIEDLYIEIDTYIDSLGYAREQNQNIRAALLTRIKSLMSGAKGFMLNTTNSIDIEEIIKYPTILELEGIADDEEKSLIMGFIMMSVYEYLRASDCGYSNKLKHLIVIEEAHRLFANVSSSQNQELVNTKGKSVEALSNILCEIRAYGEGMIIVDQVPTKLAPDVLKNTNTKIIHRLVSKDDCEYISKAIQINDDNIDFISKLKVGEVLIYNDTIDSTAHLKIDFNKDEYKYFNNNEVREFSKVYNLAIFENRGMHPISETLLTYDKCKEEILSITKEFINNILNQSIYNLKEYYYEAYKNYLILANNNGFAIEDNQYEFVDDLILSSCKIIVGKSKLSNNVLKKSYLLEFIKKLVDMSKCDDELKINKLLMVMDIYKNNFNGEFI